MIGQIIKSLICLIKEKRKLSLKKISEKIDIKTIYSNKIRSYCVNLLFKLSYQHLSNEFIWNWSKGYRFGGIFNENSFTWWCWKPF